MPVYGIYMYVPYIHKLGSARRITDRLKEVNGPLGNSAIDTVDFSLMKKTAVNLKAK